MSGWTDIPVGRYFFYVGRNDRERNRESESVRGDIFDGYLTAMKRYGVFYNGETESGSSGGTGTALVDAIETFEDAGEVLGGDAAAVVFESDTDAIVCRISREPDLRGTAVGEGV